MTIHLKIENFDQMPDGGPVEITENSKNIEIGRAIERDWTLPDPKNYISSRHCEIKYKNGEYWLYDLSVNGTYINGGSSRLTGPVKLSDGDRLQIGHYFIGIKIGTSVFEDTTQPPLESNNLPNQGWDSEVWETDTQAPKPMMRKDFMQKSQATTGPDFFQTYMDTPVAKPIVNEQESPFADPGAPQKNVPIPEDNPYLPQNSAPMHNNDKSLIEAIAIGAGIPSAVLTSRSTEAIGREIGEILAMSTTELAKLLKGRAAAKKMVKSSNTTMIAAHHNNPLKFVPNTNEILEIIFLQNRQGYLNGPDCFKDGFKDLQEHEVATFNAMQKALKKLLDQLEPDTIENSLTSSSFGFKKSKAWESYVERWNAKTESYDNGMLDVFLQYFAEAYDNTTSKK